MKEVKVNSALQIKRGDTEQVLSFELLNDKGTQNLDGDTVTVKL